MKLQTRFVDLPKVRTVFRVAYSSMVPFHAQDSRYGTMNALKQALCDSAESLEKQILNDIKDNNDLATIHGLFQSAVDSINAPGKPELISQRLRSIQTNIYQYFPFSRIESLGVLDGMIRLISSIERAEIHIGVDNTHLLDQIRDEICVESRSLLLSFEDEAYWQKVLFDWESASFIYDLFERAVANNIRFDQILRLKEKHRLTQRAEDRLVEVEQICRQLEQSKKNAAVKSPYFQKSDTPTRS